ncbi:SdiA-regulated domain-containing protein [Winogradskyella schleiferi]|uniref:SdiA-regulated domain-containing protein n=1 Tax=Winogradskyella schleiferi TaxID=2686078 RepID=UPI0015BDCEAC|nr:SdiA-regulated domain-containing protein [Winogradskyella schleiferi]
MSKRLMKITKSNSIAILTVICGIVLLALQIPVTNALVKKSNRLDAKFSKFYTIQNTYLLPEVLNEVSGITWLSNNVFACVQDENGFIYIYNVEQNEVINKIEFANSGDYEGIAINGKDAYVIKSDGLIYEIKNYESDSLEVSEFKTPFKQKNNIESLVFDKQNNRLLTATKDEDLGDKHLKSIYQIPLSTKKMDEKSIVNIDLKAKVLEKFQHKKIEKTFNPSDIAIHPKTKDIYVIDGKDPKLLILNSKGEILKVFELDKRKFAQPEGITFSKDGRLFISNEATDESANILEVQLRNG